MADINGPTTTQWQKRGLALVTVTKCKISPDGEWTPSGCCNRKGSSRPPAARQQRSTSADQDTCHSCPKIK